MPLEHIVYPFLTSRTLARVAGYACLLAVYGALPLAKEYTRFANVADLPSEIHAALTLVLGWLLVFRTNTAYGRWWEARTLWGALVNASRNLTVKVRALTGLSPEDRGQFEQIITNFPHALRDHLRNPVANRPVGDEMEAGPTAHRPSQVVTSTYQLLWNWKANGKLDGDELRILDVELARFLDVCGGCERIRNTRVAYSYRVFARQCVFLFLLTFPWGIAEDFRWWTIPLTGITAYFMLGLEIVAEDIEEPFGHDDDDLDLDTLCQVIDDSTRSILRST